MRKKVTRKKASRKLRQSARSQHIDHQLEQLNAALKLRLQLEEAQAKKEFVWETADHRLVKPAEMTEEHLRNAISYVQRRLVHEFGRAKYLISTRYFLQALLAFINEAENRGIMV